MNGIHTVKITFYNRIILIDNSEVFSYAALSAAAADRGRKTNEPAV